MKKRLLISSSYNGEVIAEITWEDGQISIDNCKFPIKQEIERIVDYGLSEWLGISESHPEHRYTRSSDAKFIARLADYYKRQFNFSLTVSGEVEWRDASNHQWKAETGR